MVANIQTLRNKVTEVRDIFGTVITDEMHHIAATTFKGTIDALKAKYKIGLSATLWRKDGKHVIFNDYFGNKTFMPKDDNALKPIITIIQTEIPFSDNVNTPWATKVNELNARADYTELVINASQAQVERGHKVLTVSDRTEFLSTCAAVLDNFKLILGSSSDRSFDHTEYAGIFGSIKIFSEGVNMPRLSCLVIATPVNNRALLEQLIGRVVRLCEGKQQPEVIDIALKGNTGRRQLAARINYYTEKNYEIRYL